MKFTDDVIERAYLRLSEHDKDNIDRQVKHLQKSVRSMGIKSALELLAVIGAFMVQNTEEL